MHFNSQSFFLFLVPIVILYYMLPDKYRNSLLLAASYYFYYSAKPEYLIILIGSTAVNYMVARGMDKVPSQKKKLLWVSLVVNLGVLFFFKYFNFVGEQLNAVFNTSRLDIILPKHSLILPIGISFYTFMAIGYILDVYWGDIKHQKNYLTFSLYMAFFPQILCGPIGRAKNLFKQYTTMHPLLYDNFANGFRLILWGLFKKMVVADNIGVYVNAVFGNIPLHTSISLVTATLLFPMQLYADFSGYSDIARGVAKLFGYDLMVNFKTPYVNSTSVTDYWRRNHLSLTLWFRDYLYYPFMGVSVSKAKVYLGIFIMFIASGIWHGASWMFILWGMTQGIYLVLEDMTGWDSKFVNSKLFLNSKRFPTYLLVSVGLLFFRLDDLTILKAYISGLMQRTSGFFIGSKSLILNISVGLVTLCILDLLLNRTQLDEYLSKRTATFRWALYTYLTMMLVVAGNFGNNNFLYYQF